MTPEEASAEADKLCQELVGKANAASWAEERASLNVVFASPEMTRGVLKLLLCCSVHENNLKNAAMRQAFMNCARRFAQQHILTLDAQKKPQKPNTN